MSLQVVKSLIQFSRGSQIVWEALETAIPAGVVTFSVDSGEFRLGDGVTLYRDQPVLFTFDNLVEAQHGIVKLFREVSIDDQGKIVVVSANPITGEMEYAPSDTTLSSLLLAINDLDTSNANQDIAIATLLAGALSIDINIGSAASRTLVVVSGGKYSASNITIDEVEDIIGEGVDLVSEFYLEDPIWWSSTAKTTELDPTVLYDNTSVYLEVKGFSNLLTDLVFGVEATNSNIVISKVNPKLFKITFNNVCAPRKELPIVFNITIGKSDDMGEIIAIKKAIATLVRVDDRIMVGTYHGSSVDVFHDVAIDSSDNIICVGETKSEGSNQREALIVKFDPSLGIIARKIYGGTGPDNVFYGIELDSLGNIICVGHTKSEGPGAVAALIVKFNSNLNMLARKYYGGIGNDIFYGVTVDSANNIICVGSNTSTGGGYYYALAIKFDSSLNMLANKVFGNGGHHTGFSAVTTDSLGNIICVGNTTKDAVGGTADPIVVKFDSDIANPVIHRHPMNAGGYYYDVVMDNLDNVYCVGTNGSASIFVKLANNLTPLALGSHSGTGTKVLNGIALDSESNIIVVGKSTGYGPIISKIDGDLNLLAGHSCDDGNGLSSFRRSAVDSRGNIFCVGHTNHDASGNYKALIMKVPITGIPSGTFELVESPWLTIKSQAQWLLGETWTYGTSDLVLSDSALNTGDSTLTLADSNLEFLLDAFFP